MSELWQHPIVRGAVLGLWSALVVDLSIWLKSTTWKIEGFDVRVASKRWVTGGVAGAMGAAGLGAL